MLPLNAEPGASEAATPFKPPPDELKVLSPYLQRAHETRKADPALAYWCNYHAAQMGISRAGSLSPAARAFLINLMDTLEQQKKSLTGNDIVHGDDLVAKAHIENVALKVFGGADNEDRTGKATRATARRFLVAGNFIEVLTNFGPLDTEMEEKLKYAKWKAADIARAFREGRKPTPGPAGGLEVDEGTLDVVGGQNDSGAALTGIEAAAARLGGLSADAGALPSKDELDAEMARLSAQENHEVSNDAEDDRAEAVALSSPHVDPPSLEQSQDDVTTPQRHRAQSRLSYDGRISGGLEGFNDIGQVGSPSLANSSSPNFSMPMRISRPASQASEESFRPLKSHLVTPTAGTGVDNTSPGETQSAFFQYTQGRLPSSGTASPHNRPLPHPPTASSEHARAALQLPPTATGQSLSNPTVPPLGLSPSTTPKEQQGSFTPYPIQQASLGQLSGVPSAPPAPNVAPVLVAPSAPPSDATPASLPASLTLAQTARVQKLAKWAVSALDYEDLDTARKQLREALDICEGRAPSSAYVSR